MIMRRERRWEIQAILSKLELLLAPKHVYQTYLLMKVSVDPTQLSLSHSSNLYAPIFFYYFIRCLSLKLQHKSQHPLAQAWIPEDTTPKSSRLMKTGHNMTHTHYNTIPFPPPLLLHTAP